MYLIFFSWLPGFKKKKQAITFLLVAERKEKGVLRCKYIDIFWLRLKTLAFVTNILILSFVCVYIKKKSEGEFGFFFSSSSYDNKIQKNLSFFSVLVKIVKMNGKDVEGQRRTSDIITIPPSPYTEERKASIAQAKIARENLPIESFEKKKRNIGQSFGNFLYNPQRKTVLGRNALNWGKIKKNSYI